MSTREIAELTGKLHTNVIRDFREMCEALEIGELKFESSYQTEQNKHVVMYLLPKDLTTTLISGYSIPMRHAIVTRWLELEAAAAPALPASYREALKIKSNGVCPVLDQPPEPTKYAKNSHHESLQVNPQECPSRQPFGACSD